MSSALRSTALRSAILPGEIRSVAISAGSSSQRLRASVQAVSCDVVRAPRRERDTDRLPGRTRRRTSVEEIADPRHAGRTCARSPPGSPARARRRRPLESSRGAWPPPGVASDSTRSGSCHLGSPAATSPPTIRNSSLSGAWECSSSRVSTVNDGPWRCNLDIGHGEARSPRTASRQSSSRCSGPGSSSTGLCGGIAGGNQHHAIEAKLKVRLLGAHEVSKMWRVERPAEDPDAHCE